MDWLHINIFIILIIQIVYIGRSDSSDHVITTNFFGLLYGIMIDLFIVLCIYILSYCI